MDFVVDKVSEDSFYVNLLLGLPKQLEKFKKFGVSAKHLTRRCPLSHTDICAWEQKQSILLPEDLRNFYSSTDGFLFTWTFTFGDKSAITGKIEINQLQDLCQIFGYETKVDPGVKVESDNYELRLGLSSKVFELVKLGSKYKVLLVYLNTRYSPTIWVSTGPQEYYFLADDFATYFRMCVAHLGVPNWQLLFTPKGVPQWTENMIRLLSPNLLKSKRTTELSKKFRERRFKNDFFDVTINKLDISIFKCLPKVSQGGPRVEKEKIQSPRRKKSEQDKNNAKFQRKPLYYNNNPKK